jgi:dephospho-CoA kinase
MLIAVTGQTGSGKTTFCRTLEELGFAVIYADLSARAVVEKGKPCLKMLADIFGLEIIAESGELNRPKLADIVFNDREKLQILNDTMYPFITEHIFNIIAKLPKNTTVVLDAPTLFESRINLRCDLIIGILASSEQEQTARIMKRDNITEQQVKARIASQKPQKFFIENCDINVNKRNLESLLNLFKMSAMR